MPFSICNIANCHSRQLLLLLRIFCAKFCFRQILPNFLFFAIVVPDKHLVHCCSENLLGKMFVCSIFAILSQDKFLCKLSGTFFQTAIPDILLRFNLDKVRRQPTCTVISGKNIISSSLWIQLGRWAK